MDTAVWNFASRRVQDLALDPSGVYAAGVTEGALFAQSAGGRDAFLRKFDGNGSELWTRQVGTSADDYGYGISADASGVYLAGQTAGTFLGQTSAGGTDIFVRKYNPAGIPLWTQQLGTAGADLVRAHCISAAASGIYVAGFTSGAFSGQTSAGMLDAFVVKFTPARTD